MTRAKPIRTTEDAIAWIDDAVASGRISKPKTTGDGDGLRYVVSNGCRRCGGSGETFYGVCWGCSGNGGFRKTVTPIEFARKARAKLRAQDKKAAEKEARKEAARERNTAKGYGPLTGAEVYAAKVAASQQRRWSARNHRSHVGQVDHEWVGTATIIGAREVHSRFGARLVVTFVTGEGNILTLWSMPGEFDYSGGRLEIRLRATVSKHTEYDAEPRTEIRDLEVLEIVGACPAPSAADVLVIAEYLEQDDTQLLSEIERADLITGAMPDWVLAEIGDHPLVRRGLATLRAQSEAA